MASFVTEGFSEELAKLERMNLFDDAAAEEMLFAAGDVVVDEIQRAMQQAPHRIAHLASKVRYKRKVKKGKDGCPYVTVSASGRNESGDLNATVLFVLNYGRSPKYGQITGSYFWTKALENAAPKVSEKVQEITSKILRERGVTD